MLRRYRYVVGWEGKAIDLELHVRTPPGSSRAVCMYVVRLCAIDKITPARSGLVLAPRPLSLQYPACSSPLRFLFQSTRHTGRGGGSLQRTLFSVHSFFRAANTIVSIGTNLCIHMASDTNLCGQKQPSLQSGTRVCEVMDTVLVCECVSGHIGATCTCDTLGLELPLRWSEWLLPGESEAELQFILDARTIVPKH